MNAGKTEKSNNGAREPDNAFIRYKVYTNKVLFYMVLLQEAIFQISSEFDCYIVAECRVCMEWCD